VETLLRLIGNFDHDVTVGDVKRRENQTTGSKDRGGDGFKGQLVILVDSDSGSASELARVMQLKNEGRCWVTVLPEK
jgi:C-terminal processing protease CtpA/Prc